MNRFFCIFKFVKSGKYNYVNISIIIIKPFGQLKSIHIWHFNICNNNIRLSFFDKF